MRRFVVIRFVGRLVQEIEKLNIANDTLILFTSDNGPSLRWGLCKYNFIKN